MEANPRAVSGGNIPPPDDPKPDRTFKRRWAFALFQRPDKPAGAVAMGFKLYMEMDGQGCGATVSDAEFQVSCGVSDGACRTFKRWLVSNGFIQILIRGRRGYRSEFRAVIPQEQLAAQDAAIPDTEYRQPIPAMNAQNHATQPATTAGIVFSAESSRARIDSPSESNNTYNKQPTTTVGDPSARGGGGIDFDVLNGSAIDLAAFIAKHAKVDLEIAQRMLTNNIKAFGADAMLEAYSMTTAEMAGGMVGAPYKYLMGVAKGAKERAQRFSRHRQVTPEDTDAAAAKAAREKQLIADVLKEGRK